MDENIASIRRLVSLRDTQYTLGGIGRTTVYDLVDKKELVKVNVGRRMFITADSIDGYLNRLVEGRDGEAATSTATGNEGDTDGTKVSGA